MARTFRQRRQMHAVAELNVTNLVDLAFTLLIIFMLATPLMQQEQTIPVDLPVQSTSPQDKPDKDTVFETVTIDRQGRYSVGNTQVSFSELQSRLQGFAAKTKQPVIRIRADLSLQWQQVVTLMDELKKVNLSKITFDTQTNG
ncbi:MAG: biopolymer transporter ExbD [Opitutaceae bacterium]|jgi:biopolymer transport protein ExbD